MPSTHSAVFFFWPVFLEKDEKSPVENGIYNAGDGTLLRCFYDFGSTFHYNLDKWVF